MAIWRRHRWARGAAQVRARHDLPATGTVGMKPAHFLSPAISCRDDAATGRQKDQTRSALPQPSASEQAKTACAARLC
jgi:hypothetical protein